MPPPPLNSLKLTFCLTLAVLWFTATAFGDTATGDTLTRAQYADLNSSYDTFQVARGNDANPLSPHELFNFAATAYSSATGQSVATYNSAADFYADRGVKSLVSDWTVSEGSQIVGMFGVAVFNYSINLTNSTGTVWSTTAGQGLPFGTQDTWINSLDSSRNINVGALGAVNMTLTGSWKANAANDDPVWADGLSDADKEWARTWVTARRFDDYSTTVYGDQPELNGGVISMVAYDVTDLLKAMGSEYADIENAFMFAWENWNWGTEQGKRGINFDYNDWVYIMTNVTPNTTPEPATMLIFGLGIAGVAAARRMKRK